MDQTLFPKPAFVRFPILSNKLYILFYRYDYNDVLLNANFRSALHKTDLLNSAHCAHPWPRWIQKTSLMRCQHWFRQWLAARQRSLHYFSQCWTSSMSLHGLIILQCGLVMPYSENISTLAQAIACCLTAPIHCLNQYWLIIVISDFNNSSSNNLCHTVIYK